MSKPLQLTIYPWVDRWVDWNMEFLGKPMTGSSREYGYETPHGVWSGDEFPEKRLTDADMAAEFHKSTSDFMSAHSLHMLFEDAETEQKLSDARDWMFAMERFAILPHYDEVA